MSEEYFIDKDNSFHRYLIPYSKKEEWAKWLELDEDDEASWEEPEWAKRIDGGLVVFKEFRIDV